MANINAKHLYDYRNNILQERTLIATASDGTGVRSASNDVEYWDGAGVLQEIFTPSAGASAPRAVNSRDYEYFVDDIAADQTAWNIANGTSKWGIVAPTTAPSIAATSGTSASWSANTIFSTFGAIVDANNNVEQMVSINATGSNSSTSLGKTGFGQPAWNQTPAGTTADGGITWTNKGPVGLWSANHAFSNGTTGGTAAAPSVIFDPTSQGLFIVASSGVNSGNTRPPFTATLGWTFTESTGLKWVFNGTPALGQQWQPNTFYSAYGSVSNNDSISSVIEPVPVTKAYNTISNSFNQPVYVQASNGHTSAASFASPAFQTGVGTPGTYIYDGDIIWLNLGTATRPNATLVTAWAPGATNFTVIKDGNGNLQVCITGGTTAGAPPVFNTGYGVTTNETSGPVVWVNVGTSLNWTANTQWFLPPTGFTAPQTVSSFGGADIIDSNKNLETVINSGLSGATVPAWAPVGGNTTDGTITWFDVEATGGGGTGVVTLVTSIGRRYYLVFLNTTKQNFSDLSPVSNATGPITNGQVALFNLAISGDPQVDQKVVLSTADGGDPSTLYFVGQVSNATTTLNDNIPEELLVLGNIYAQIDINGNEIGLIANDPPPANGSFPTVHQGRVWLAKNNFVFYSKSLGDVTTSTGIIAGRYEEDWPPSNAIDITPGSEFISGMLSDGYSLFIATERHIRRLTGTAPFTLPPIVFSEAGVLSQDVWKIVFLEGTPVGSMWLTPDFRVIGSDFNTYNDVGTSIQSTLNTINPSAINACWAETLSYGPYNFYVLAIPTGNNTTPNTWCVYDMHLRKWYIWNLAEPTLSGIFYFSLAGVPRLLITAPAPAFIDMNDKQVGVNGPLTVTVSLNGTPPVQSYVICNETFTGSFPQGNITLPNGFSNMPGQAANATFIDGQGIFPANVPISISSTQTFSDNLGVGSGVLTSFPTNGVPVATVIASSSTGQNSIGSTNPVAAGTTLIAIIKGQLFNTNGQTVTAFTDTNGNVYKLAEGIHATFNGTFGAMNWIYYSPSVNANANGNNVTYSYTTDVVGPSTRFNVYQVTNLLSATPTTLRFIDQTKVVDTTSTSPLVNVPIVSTIRTSWLHLGDAAMRKTLNEIELVTSDTGLLVTLEGATNQLDFQNPNVIFSNIPLTANIFGQLKVFTSGFPLIYRFYRFTFTSTSSITSSLADVILGYFSAEVLPLNRI